MALKQGVLATSTQRMLVLAGLAVLLLTAPSIYFVSTFYPYGGNVPNVIVPGSNAGSADSQLNPGTVEESWKDAFTLQPNDHIFRKPQTIRATWNVTMEERAPDGVKKMVYLINGMNCLLHRPPRSEVRQHTYTDRRSISRTNYRS